MQEKTDFIHWLTENTFLSPATINKYAGAVNTISRGLKEKEALQGSLYYIKDPVVIEKWSIKYFSIIEFYEKNKRGNNMYSNAIKYYIKFRH